MAPLLFGWASRRGPGMATAAKRQQRRHGRRKLGIPPEGFENLPPAGMYLKRRLSGEGWRRLTLSLGVLNRQLPFSRKSNGNQ